MINSKTYEFVKGVNFSECPEGWHQILDNALSYVDYLISSRKSRIKQVILEQVKEKYGSLRIYHAYEYLENKIEEEEPTFHQTLTLEAIIENIFFYAEYLSSITCEICGSPGNLTINKYNWYTTRCEQHKPTLK